MTRQGIAIITGAAGDLGSAVAARLASRIKVLVLVDRDRDRLEALGAALSATTDIEAVAGDVGCVEDVEHYVDVARQAGDGTIDALFNNAGIEGAIRPIDNYPISIFDRVMTTNVRSVFLGLKHTASFMRRGGVILNTASTGGITGAADMAAYIASKHAVVGLTKAAALDLAPRGIRVNAICPGPISGRMMDAISKGLSLDPASLTGAKIPVGRYATAEEVAQTACFMLSRDSSYMTGSIVTVDGGRTAG